MGFQDFNYGTMAYTGTWFLPVTLLGIIPSAIYGLYLIAIEGKIIGGRHNNKNNVPFLIAQLKILFWGSITCLIIALITNILNDDLLGFTGELHLASIALSLQIGRAHV